MDIAKASTIIGCAHVHVSLSSPSLPPPIASCLPFIPDKGTVGASGDLAPLSHLALGMMGEGNMWCPESGWGQASDILHAHQLKPITLQAKEVCEQLIFPIYRKSGNFCCKNVFVVNGGYEN